MVVRSQWQSDHESRGQQCCVSVHDMSHSRNYVNFGPPFDALPLIPLPLGRVSGGTVRSRKMKQEKVCDSPGVSTTHILGGENRTHHRLVAA